MRRFLTGLLIFIILVGGGFAAGWFVRGSDNSTNTTTPATTTAPANTQAAAQDQIRTNWTKFFNGSTSAQDKISLLQNGQQYAQTIQAQASSATAKATTATVSNVSVSGTTATVTYTIDINGQPSLSNQTGQAVKENGVWKVSDTAFCGLLKLSGTVPPNCPGGSSQQPQAQTQTPSGTTTQ